MAGFVSCGCWNLHSATQICLIVTGILAIIASFLTALDLADTVDTGWAMTSTFNVDWRWHINDVVLALDVILVLAHIIMVVSAIVTFIFVKKKDSLNKNVGALTYFSVMMSLYTLYEFAYGLYIYTWYNYNIWTLPYLAFTFIFWLIRTILNILSVVVAHSRIRELRFQKRYDILHMPGVKGSLSAASTMSGSMRSLRTKGGMHASKASLYSQASQGAPRYNSNMEMGRAMI